MPPILKSLDRRTFLRGAASTTIGLPLLESMLNSNGTALANGAELPRRLVIFFCPTSLVTSSSTGNHYDAFTPSKTGSAWEITPCLQPLADAGLKGQVSVVSGLFVPPSQSEPGGFDNQFHHSAYISIFTGGRSHPASRFNGISADIAAGEALAKETPFPSVSYQVDPTRTYVFGMSFGRKSGGGFQPVEPQVSPTQAYRKLFSSFSGSVDEPQPQPAEELRHRLRVSSLSYAKDSIVALRKRVGVNDQRTLDEWFEQFRTIEQRLLKVPAEPPPTACSEPQAVTADPGDSDYDARVTLFIDLVGAALACDLTRSVALSMTVQTYDQGIRHPVWSGAGLHNGVQHGAGNATLQAANKWFVGHYAALLKKLAVAPQGSADLLGSTAAVFMMEGGKAGRSADGGQDPNHSTDNMVALLAGSAGGLKAGQHVVARDQHPAVVLNTALKAIGVTHQLGDIKGHLTQLF